LAHPRSSGRRHIPRQHPTTGHQPPYYTIKYHQCTTQYVYSRSGDNFIQLELISSINQQTKQKQKNTQGKFF
jgi:hypothetical protein